jgi:hypothetical protein
MDEFGTSKVVLSREQDQSFREYDDVEIEIPRGKTMSVGDVRKKFGDKMNITPQMIILVEGVPRSDNFVLEDGQRLYGKEQTKARGV